MKKITLAFLALALVQFSFAQNVFTYGKYAVTKEEFVKAFNKNPGAARDRKKALKEYLELYINFKLKVQAAYDEGLNKDGTQLYELENFKKQVADNIINDEANVKSLVQQAFERSLKEIHLQHVFIEVLPDKDTAEAYKQINAAYKQLREGKEFETVSQQYSTDQQTRESKGELGYITAFTLPYDIENTVYNVKINTFSQPVRTRAGYHIFKNAGERKSSGTRRVAQILITLPPNANELDKKLAASKADSVYKLLISGADFGELASTVSNDVSTSNNKGELPELTVGKYNAAFEKIAFSMQNGAISKPFLTDHGYHILKLLEIKAPPEVNDAFTYSILQDQVVKDDRLELAKKEVIRKKLSQLKLKHLINQQDLYVFTDSATKGRTSAVKGVTENTTIFSFAKQNVKAGDWIKYVRSRNNPSYGTSSGGYKELFQDFINSTADDYYRRHLGNYNRDFTRQLTEFTEANLLFGIMEKKVWGMANTDTSGLIHYYNQNKSKYSWPSSADAVVVTSTTENIAIGLRQLLINNLNNWRNLTGNKGSDVIADSSRFELTQLTVPEKTNFTPGLLTAPVKNNPDGTYTFYGIINVYNGGEARSFEDARGLVIGDYQQVLENKWVKDLRKKYPVRVNEAVFQSIK